MALVSAHVAAPHRFPSYFPHEWLQHVRDSDCRTLLETRSADGRKVSGVTSVQPLHVGYRHTSLDVAAFVLHDVTAESILNAGLQILKLDDDDATHIGERVKIGGYRLQGESGSGTESVLKVELEGEVTERNKYRGFVDTGNVDSEMGMCGGPVVLNGAPEICLGLLEGLVPRPEKEQVAEEAHRRLAGKSVFIGARELKMFLHDVETDNAQESRKRSKATAMPDK